MRVLPALALALVPLSSQAETFSCTFSTLCETARPGCDPVTSDTPFALIIAEDGQTATMSTLDEGLILTFLATGEMGRSFLLRDRETGLGILTLGPDGTLAVVSNELNIGGLIGIAGQGHCAEETG
jgi:hypothetical protein